MENRALEMLDAYGLLSALAAFDPCVVGTYPLGLAVDGSDIDIACQVVDPQPFIECVTAAFGHLVGFKVTLREDTTPWRVLARFSAGGFPVEVFGEPTPVSAQHGYRHMVIEQRLLSAGGLGFRQALVERRRAGSKTEPAFADELGLPGDPYLALLQLEDLDDHQLGVLIRSAGLRSS